MAKGLMKYHGGDNVRFGFYWNVREWEAQIVPKEGDMLKGSPSVTYIRMPLVALLVLAPLMGAVYAMFLPFIGIAMVILYLAGKFRGIFKKTPPAVGAEARGDRKKAA